MNESRVEWKGAAQEEQAKENMELVQESKTEPAGETAIHMEFGRGAAEFGERTANITVPAGKSLTAYMLCDAPVSFSGELCCEAEENARLRLVQLILTPRGKAHVLKIQSRCADNASFEVLQLFLGEGSLYSECAAGLEGEASAFVFETAYLAGACQRVDYNIAANHIGKRSKSVIRSDGALRDGAFKVFRGTIDFKNGSSGAEGEEQENVLLLGDELCSQSVPLILCAEENVKGAHGASVGGPDEDALLYFAARGMDKETAEGLLTRGRLSRFCERLGDELLKERAQAAMNERL